MRSSERPWLASCPRIPIGAFVIGFGSHFVLDAIPHWDYPIKSRSVDPKFGAPVVFDSALRRDTLTIGFDAVFGIMIALLVFGSRESFWAVLVGAVADVTRSTSVFVCALATRSASNSPAVSSLGAHQQENRQYPFWRRHADDTRGRRHRTYDGVAPQHLLHSVSHGSRFRMILHFAPLLSRVLECIQVRPAWCLRNRFSALLSERASEQDRLAAPIGDIV
jgi:hypothetical protein